MKYVFIAFIYLAIGLAVPKLIIWWSKRIEKPNKVASSRPPRQTHLDLFRDFSIRARIYLLALRPQRNR
jgi:hypothetical protein